MTVNEKLIMEVWDWVSFKAGSGEGPAWMQTVYATDLSVAGDATVGCLARDIQEDFAAATEGYCGTAFCVAGYVLREHTVFDEYGDGNLIVDAVLTNVDGKQHTIKSENNFDTPAAFLLGIDVYSAMNLFGGGNNKERVRLHLQNILTKAGSSVTLH